MTRLINAGDAKAWKLCKRRVWYDHYPPAEMEPDQDRFEILIQQAGEAHESKVLRLLSERGEPVEARSAEHTRELIARQTPVIYQPVACDRENRLIGKPDFLLLIGDQYQVADAKLANSLTNRPDLMIQLGLYRWLFRTELPALAYLGSGAIEQVGPEADRQCRLFLEDMQRLLRCREAPEALFAYSKCNACPYRELCVPEFEAREDLSLLYGLDPRSVPGLIEQGITCIGDLASANPQALQDVPYLKGVERKQRAVWQAQSYRSGRMRVVERINLPEGTWIHFDVETNPLSDLGSEVYLWGMLPPPYASSAFEYVWSEGGELQDYQGWSDFLQLVSGYRERYPNLVLAHFANFEVTQIKTYAQRYDMLDDERVRWLLGSDTPLFDLREVVRKSLVLPLQSYGLKAICKSPQLVNFQWELEESGSQWSVVRYIDYLNELDEQKKIAIKAEILSYNRDDVKATRALEEWLRALPE